MPAGPRGAFDGGHKRDAFLTETFGRIVEWVPVGPEVECDLGTPRESMRLVRVEDGVRLLTVKSGVDLTAQVEAFLSIASRRWRARRQRPMITETKNTVRRPRYRLDDDEL